MIGSTVSCLEAVSFHVIPFPRLSAARRSLRIHSFLDGASEAASDGSKTSSWVLFSFGRLRQKVGSCRPRPNEEEESLTLLPQELVSSGSVNVKRKGIQELINRLA